MIRRNSWYEDDVIEYTSGGRLPKIPERYRYCSHLLGKHTHIFKSFRTEKLAKVALRAVTFPYKNFKNQYTIFRCKKCGMFHIISNDNVNKYRKDIKAYNIY